jgi:hypothetical protein
MIEWEVEDYLQEYKAPSNRPVFCSMFDENKSAHTDSYGTCLNYTEFLHAYDNSPYTKEQWKQCAQYWTENENCGIPLKIIGKFILSE